ncbi:putative peroxisomal membrane protein PEX13 isoform X2 [Apostichopus japonicus]|uniref:Peroxisomal membrane protein PEX13 n=1 Tax=Stichopus japonicus TaxID=307972 RepID=A0A2G8KMH1_STIJA|nr:putative peroxisomal membrane protein PEX13 isoform X2 [Apostichopus japonicus]
MDRGSLPIPGAGTFGPALPSRNGIATQTGVPFYGTSNNRFGGYSSGYNSYGYGSGSPYSSNFGSMYSPYGYSSNMYGSRYGNGQGYNEFGGPEGYSRFLQQAEENSRPAFQSIESIVQAFASVSMMLDSTFQTVHNCFRAVLGVADHFSRLKVNMARILSALTIFRFLRYTYHRLLEMLRLRQSGFAEEVWKEAANNAVSIPGAPNGPGGKASPSWPIFMFFAVVVGGPYVIWRLLCNGDGASLGVPEWASGEEDHVVARAEYDFDSDRQDEVSFKAGNVLNLAPKELQPNIRGWLLASVDGEKVGLVPGNYIKVQGRRKGRKHTMQPGGERQIVSSSSSIPPIPGDTGATAQPAGLPGDVTSGTNLSSSWNEWSAPKTDQESQLSAFNEIYQETGDTEKKECCSGQSSGQSKVT